MARTMEIIARKDEVNGEKEGQYRETSLEFFLVSFIFTSTSIFEGS